MNSDQLKIAHFLDHGRRFHPAQEIVARVPGGERDLIDFSAYADRVDRLSWALWSLGIGDGDRVATLAWNHRRHLELYMAIPNCGAVLHTVNLRLNADQIVEIMVHAGDRALFVDASLLDVALEVVPRVPSLSRVVVVGAGGPIPTDWLPYEEVIAAQGHQYFPGPPTLSEMSPAAMSYSSATTGRPKGVVYSHRALYLHSAMLAMADTWAISRDDTVMPVVPMFHVNAWGIPFTAIWMGAKIVLPGERPGAEDLLDLLQEEEVTFAAAVPTVWLDVLSLMEREDRELPSLRMVVSGGGPLPAGLLDQADRLGVPLVHAYGMTEATPLTHVNRAAERAKRGSPGELRERRLRQGLLVPGLEMSVVDEEGRAVPWDGETPGELQLHGPWVAEQYDRDSRSAEAFDGGWYRTGDIVNVDAEGYLLIVDRTQDLIKSGGEWISSVGIESALSEHDSVRRAAAIGVPHPRWQERPYAFIELTQAEAVQSDELRVWLEERIPRWWVPEKIEIVGQIPLTHVGKIDKRALREMAAGTTSNSQVGNNTEERDND